jgi:DNA-binding transcriptional MerR regulator
MALAKSAEAFRTISEAAGELDVPQHVLRHWEEVFGQIRPMRRAGGRRYYRPLDIDVLRGVRFLLREQRYTTEGVQKIFKQYGVKYVAEIGRMSAAGQSIELRPLVDEEASDRVAEFVSDALSADEAAAVAELPEPLRRRLAALLSKLERVQNSLDEATLAIEAIDAEVENGS